MFCSLRAAPQPGLITENEELRRGGTSATPIFNLRYEDEFICFGPYNSIHFAPGTTEFSLLSRIVPRQDSP